MGLVLLLSVALKDHLQSARVDPPDEVRQPRVVDGVARSPGKVDALTVAGQHVKLVRVRVRVRVGVRVRVRARARGRERVRLRLDGSTQTISHFVKDSRQRFRSS